MIPLVMAGPMEKVVVTEIQGGRGLTARLTDMGLTPGVEVEIVSNSGGGPVIVSIGDTRLALGRGMANKIMVSPK